MAYDPLGLEKRIRSAEIQHRRPAKYTVIGYGPGRTRVHTERGCDAVTVGGGTDTKISGYYTKIEVEATLDKLIFRVETIPETGAKILHITGG